jgi:hypothetical protein
MNIELYLGFLQDVAEKGNVQEAAQCWEMFHPEKECWMQFGTNKDNVPTFMAGVCYRRKPNRHPHAELMLAFAKDALETAEPWLRWEFQRSDDPKWRDCSCTPAWNPKFKYSRKG